MAGFGYDAANRLIASSASPRSPGTVSFTKYFNYGGDGSNGQYGNVSCSLGGTGYCPQLSFSSQTNRITGIGSFVPAYDGNGNMLTDGSNTYTYDAENRLSSAAYRWTVVYNALGERVQMHRQGGDVADYVYDLAGNYIGCWDVPGSFWYAQNIPFQGRTLVYFSQSGGGTRFFHVNALGSADYATRPTGAASLQAMLYYPYGEIWQDTTGATWDERFAGMPERDADINLDWTPNRMYAPGLGRWMTPDPAGLAAAESVRQSAGEYARPSAPKILDNG